MKFVRVRFAASKTHKGRWHRVVGSLLRPALTGLYRGVGAVEAAVFLHNDEADTEVLGRRLCPPCVICCGGFRVQGRACLMRVGRAGLMTL